ncbi:MAG: DUF4838 domain-containing protein [Ferruginibacter sp.]|nr:DUF4838 domain-containing protein [Ferruginibacter sp.]
MHTTKAQTVYYPVGSSQLLKATVQDVAMLLQQAITGSQFTIQEYTIAPTSGIVLHYNENGFAHNQQCIVKSNGQSLITFTAPQDNGLIFGVYEYLQNLGFRFYQPGSIWQITPTLSSPYKNIDTLYTTQYKYKSWFISGGYRAWAMDKTINYTWDIYGGENGYNWALYQRRNGMFSQYSFKGHRADIVNGDYLNTIKNNVCYIAEHNGQRTASTQSVPDVNNANAVNLWYTTIEKKYTASLQPTAVNQSTINFKRNSEYSNYHIGIEVPDGSQWGNTNKLQACGVANQYPSEADQNFILANKTAEYVNSIYPNKKFQVYAYASHANVPSNNININKNIDVQLIPTVYQIESSTKGLRNRWLNKTNQLSEYHYLNLSAWSGELPSFKWDELKQTLNTAKANKTQGFVWEASPAKFGSLPYLFAANNFLKNNIEVDKTLEVFCNDMFGEASKTMYQFFQLIGSEEQTPSRQKLQLYINLLNEASRQINLTNEILKARLLEVKAYVHYMCMYFENAATTNPAKKIENEEALCLYLAKVSKMQLVNSYFLISSMLSKYEATNPLKIKYNVVNGTAYNNGNLPQITATEIEQNFRLDAEKYSNLVNNFKYVSDDEVAANFATLGLKPISEVSIKINYTNGMNYYSKAGYAIIANKKGSFKINYKAKYDNANKGYVNFVVEAADEDLNIIKDVVLSSSNTQGEITINLPKAGRYYFSMVTKYQVTVDLSIQTNGNLFYNKGGYSVSRINTYKSDANRYFYVPNQINRLYFTINNFSGGKYTMPDAFAASLQLQSINNKNIAKPILVTPLDSSFFYVDVPANERGTFWSIANANKYSIQLVNVSNSFWFVQPQKTEQQLAASITNSSVYPNPSSGFYSCTLDGKKVKADELSIFNTQGLKMTSFKNISSFNISQFPTGVYMYKMLVNGSWYSGKLVKV